MWEAGLDLHEWETRWAELQEAAADAPDEALPEVVRFVEQMMKERNLGPEDLAMATGEDPELHRNFLAAKDIAVRLDEGKDVEPDDVQTALEDLAEIYEYLDTDRAPP